MLPNWTIKRVDGAARRQTMAFIREQFAEHFGAEVTDDTTEVYAVQRATGEIDAAFGLNREVTQFFCRHYVGDVQKRLIQHEGISATGASMVELAHLCVRHPATLCRILPQLATFLAGEADYLACTVTYELARFFQRKHLAPVSLGPARISDLPTHINGEWGSYYDHSPEVVMGNLSNACKRLGTTPRPTVSATQPFHEELLQIA
jgi:thermostable hemolysin